MPERWDTTYVLLFEMNPSYVAPSDSVEGSVLMAHVQYQLGLLADGRDHQGTVAQGNGLGRGSAIDRIHPEAERNAPLVQVLADCSQALGIGVRTDVLQANQRPVALRRGPPPP